MEVNAYRILYDNIHDFKTTAVKIENDIEMYGIRHNSVELVVETGGRKHHDMWASMKTVSHYNLGISLELMLKLICFLNQCDFGHTHSLSELYDSIPRKFRRQLESVFATCKEKCPKGIKLLAFINSASPDPAFLPKLSNREISSLRGFFSYLDEDAMLWKKRYTWEHINNGDWRHYIEDISVLVTLIDCVMRDIPR